MTSENTAFTSFLFEQYGLKASDIKTLYAYEDVNLKVTTKGHDFFVKIHQHAPASQLDFISRFMQCLADNNVPTTPFLKNKSGKLWCLFEGKPCFVQKFIHGEVITSQNLTPEISFQIGVALGRMHSISQRDNFPISPHTSTNSPWYPEKFSTVIKHSTQVLPHIAKHLQTPIQDFFTLYKQEKSKFKLLKKGIVHTDFNRENILIANNKIQSIIDFSDTSYSWYASDVGTAVFYIFTPDPACWPNLTFFWQGYSQTFTLPENDIKTIALFTQLRAITSLIENIKDHKKTNQDAQKAIKYLNSDAQSDKIFSFLNP